MNLKQLVSISFALILCLQCAAQNNDYTISIKSGTENEEMRQLMKFLSIERNTVYIHSADLAGKRVALSYVEYIKGKPGKKADLTKQLPAHLVSVAARDTGYKLTFLTQEKDTSLLLQLSYPRFSMDLPFDRLSKNGYLLRTVDYNNGSYKYNEEFALFTWSLPYEIKGATNGAMSYCELTYDGIPPEKWYEEFGVEHHVIFYLKVVDGK